MAGLVVVATGCTSASTDPAGQRAESVTSAPDSALTLVADADPVASAGSSAISARTRRCRQSIVAPVLFERVASR